MTPEELAEVLAALEATPKELDRIADNLSIQLITWKPSREVFSIVENVCHLRDIEHEGYNVRIKRIATEDTPVLPDIDGRKLAIGRGYNDQSLHGAVDSFATARAKSVEMVKEMSPEKLSRVGTLEDFGDLTLAGLLEVMVEHDREHLADISKLIKNFDAN